MLGRPTEPLSSASRRRNRAAVLARHIAYGRACDLAGPARETATKEVTAMDKESKSVVQRPQQHVWEPPTAEEITVSAEATAYMGAWKDWD